MGMFDNIRPGVHRLPHLNKYQKDGSGEVRITGALIVESGNPQTKNVQYVVVEGENISHPAVAPGTPVCVFMVETSDPYNNFGTFLAAVIGDATPELAEQCVGPAQILTGKTVTIATSQKTYGRRSPKAGQTFWGQDYFPAGATTRVASVPTAPKAAPTVPEGWYPDPHGRGYYNAAGEIKTAADLGI